MSALLSTLFLTLGFLLSVIALAGKYLERKSAGLVAQAEADFHDTVVEIEEKSGDLTEIINKNDRVINLLRPKLK